MRNFSMMVVVMGSLASAKTMPTFYTAERVAVARGNVEAYKWGKAIRRRIFETGDSIKYYIGPEYTAADTYAAQSDEFMWLLQPDTRIPRVAFPRDALALCPQHGAAVKKTSVWCPWRIDPVTHPYQVQCPVGKEWYPSNPYHLGDMTSGDFPDDGNGCLFEGKRYFFLREYAHLVYGSVVIPTLRSLSQAYQLTGDATYGRKGCILLARLATQYPNYGWGDGEEGLEDRTERTYLGPWQNHHPHYRWKQGGVITDLIWETFCLEATAYAYDGLWSYMDQDSEMLAFLRSKGMPVQTATDLRNYIETYIFRAGARALLAGWIHGNEGFHQAAAMAVALVLDDYSDRHPNSRDLVEYTYHGIGKSVDIMINGILPDGGGHESPNYSVIKLDFIRVSRLMEELRKRHPEQFPAEQFPDLFADPKAEALFDYYIDVVTNDFAYPSIGDCGGLRTMEPYPKAVQSHLTHENLFAVQEYRQPRHAKACLAADGTLYTGELWEAYPEELIRELAARPEAVIRRQSRVLDDYGVAILESGDPANRRSLVLNYSSLIGHRQNDPLNLELYARKLYFLQDQGYPKTWEYRNQWDSNIMAHNTVSVDETPPQLKRSGATGRLLASVGGVHVITASHSVYEDVDLGNSASPPVTLYERTSILVDVDEERFYAVDLFLVNGGEQHDQSWHAFSAPAKAPDLAWVQQKAGTLAGPDVAEFAEWEDRWGRKRNDFPSYLTEIRRAPLAGAAACWSWETIRAQQDQLRLHIVPVDGPLQVIMGKGRSPVREKIDYLLVRREVRDGAASRFLSVVDAPAGAPTVLGVTLLEEDPLLLRVEFPGGHDLLTLQIPAVALDGDDHRPIGIRHQRFVKGEQVCDTVVGTVPGVSDPGYATGNILSVDYEESQITIAPDETGSAAWTPGRTLRLSGNGRSALYRVTAAEEQTKGLCLTLDRTPLLARARVKSVKKDILVLDSELLFCDRLSGAVLVIGEASWQIASAVHGGIVTLAAGAVMPDTAVLGKEARVFQYAPGDRVEIAWLATVSGAASLDLLGQPDASGRP